MTKILFSISFLLNVKILFSQTDTATFETFFLGAPSNLSIKETQKLLFKNKLFYDIQLVNEEQVLKAKYKANEYLGTTPDSIFFQRMPLIIKDIDNTILRKDLISTTKLKYVHSDSTENQLKTLHKYVMANFPRIAFTPITEQANSKNIVGYAYELMSDKEYFELDIIGDYTKENCILISGTKVLKKNNSFKD
jgi:hypothetical protein